MSASIVVAVKTNDTRLDFHRSFELNRSTVPGKEQRITQFSHLLGLYLTTKTTSTTLKSSRTVPDIPFKTGQHNLYSFHCLTKEHTTRPLHPSVEYPENNTQHDIYILQWSTQKEGTTRPLHPPIRTGRKTHNTTPTSSDTSQTALSFTSTQQRESNNDFGTFAPISTEALHLQ